MPASAFPQGSVVHPLLRPREPQPVWLRRQEEPVWLTTLDRGRAVYLGFHQTHSVPQGMLDRLTRLARTKKVRRVVVDARLNGGGDNTTYWSLVEAIRRAGRKAVLLVGRKTFSAAGNFAAVVDAQTRARIVGEPSGGSPNQWGDSAPVELPSLGLTVHVAVEDVQAVPADTRRRGRAGRAGRAHGGRLLRGARPGAGAGAAMKKQAPSPLVRADPARRRDRVQRLDARRRLARMQRLRTSMPWSSMCGASIPIRGTTSPRPSSRRRPRA